ncbi:DNA/RNA helicase domain-containing protein [Bacillus cereus]|uniref:DNA/RNA helicase domain-containing protein n=1 Tax=Bacillus cereus TaxID=1396 RepID=UPI000B4B4F74
MIYIDEKWYKKYKGKKSTLFTEDDIKLNKDKILQILDNIYRILLSRGRFGCVIYFENEGISLEALHSTMFADGKLLFDK